MPKKRDDAWTHASSIVINGQPCIRCNYCRRTWRSGISRFKQHLAGLFVDIVTCKKAPDYVVEQMCGYFSHHELKRRKQIAPTVPAEEQAAAPFCGPLVVDESVGGKKSSELTDVEDQVQSECRSNQVTRDDADIILSVDFTESGARSPGEDYVFQKRGETLFVNPQVPDKEEGKGTKSLTQFRTRQETETVPAGSAIDFSTCQALSCGNTLAIQKCHEGGNTYPEKVVGVLQEIKEGKNYGGSSTLRSSGFDGLDGSDVLGKPESHSIMVGSDKNFGEKVDAMTDPKHELIPPSAGMLGDSKHSHLRLSAPPKSCSGLDQVSENGDARNVSDSVGTASSYFGSKLPGAVSCMDGEGMVKKVTGFKRPGEGCASETSIMLGKKTTNKSEPGPDSSLDHGQKRLKTAKDGEPVKLSAGKSFGIGLVPEENLQVKSRWKDVLASGTSLSDFAALQPRAKRGNVEVDLSQLVSDLLGLAINPFHGVERNTPKMVRQVFLQWRSLNYQKSLVERSPNILKSPFHSVAAETAEFAREVPSSNLPERLTRPDNCTKAAIPKAPVHNVAAEAAEDARDAPSSNRLEGLKRPDNRTKSGRKRNPPELQEEKSANGPKKLKEQKLKELKSMVAEKVSTQKSPEVLLGGRKEMGIPILNNAGTVKNPEPVQQQGKRKVMTMSLSSKPDKVKKHEPEVQRRGQKEMSMPNLTKPDRVAKPEPPVEMVQPTALVMIFPPETVLPSAADLKAKFTRFGPLDHSGFRISRNSSTCRVVFKHKAHGEAARDYAVRNSTLFGNVKVKYQLWGLGVRAAEGQKPTNPPGGRNDSEGNMGLKTPPQQPKKLETHPQQPLKQTVQPKPCIKEPFGGDAKPNLDIPGESPCVKFVLDGNDGAMTDEPNSGIKKPFGNDAKSILSVPCEKSMSGMKPIFGVPPGASPHEKSLLGWSDSTSNGEQVLVNRYSSGGNFISVHSPDVVGPSSSSSTAMDVNKKNFEQVNTGSPPLPHVHADNRVHFTEASRSVDNNPAFINNNSSERANTIDISHQMLSLLMRCNDIVTDVKNTLGHKPFTPL